MPSAYPQAAVDFEKHFLINPSEVHAPFADRMELKLSDRRRDSGLR
jgi:hypothetical protein